MDADDTDAQPNLYYRLIFGSFNRKDHRLANGWPKNCDFIIGQSHCIVIVAWMFHFKYKPYEWDATHLDNIICKGDWLHFNYLCDNEKDLTKDVLLTTKTGCLFRKEVFQFEPLSNLSFFGKFTGLRGKLKKYMEGCDDKTRSILFTCKQISFGIFGYLGPDNQTEYCLFDPHGRNANGYFDYSDNSCVACFKTIDDVVSLLARDEIFTHCRYTCIPIKKRPILKGERVHLINVHNSKVHPDAYLESREWKDSSGSSNYDYSDESGDETDDETNDNFAIVSENTAPGSTETTRKSGRNVKPVERFTFAPHPSFFRGKLREDRKRSLGKWKNWYDTKTPEQKEKMRKRKNALWAINLRKWRNQQ